MMQLLDLFEEAVELGPDERAAFLVRVGQRDRALQERLAELLAADHASTDERLERADIARAERGVRAGSNGGLPARIARRADPMAPAANAGHLATLSLVAAGAPTPPGHGVDQRGLAPGVVVDGQYELIRELGRGGMGVVYLARDIRLGRLVAVKFVLVHNAAASQRFLAEARTTAQCTHQNIVQVYEADEFNGLPYMVLEYLEGKTLRRVITEHLAEATAEPRGLSAARTLEIVLSVLRALEHAHGMGIVHRDLKPENIMLTDTGVVKVLDFGIAKWVSMAADGDPAMTAGLPPGQGSGQVVPETRAGSLVGTLPYMSPEQLNGGVIDLQVDIWAVGIMLFETIEGHHPMAPLSMATFQGIAEVATPMPRTADLCAAVGALGPIIDRCLLKDKADRVGSVAELIAELEPLMPGHRGLVLADDASPFTGLSAFQESDVDRFFGRREDTLSLISRVREQPLVVLSGPSGAGKSSLVRAGLIPALKRAGEGWQSFIARPGRAPMLALTAIVDRLERAATSRRSGEPSATTDRDAMLERLRGEPGYLGSALRRYAQRKLRRVVLFIDQFEEVYTLCRDDDERRGFLACLAGIADDASSPLRVVLSMRTDFLERLSENRSFMALATRGLMLLPPMGRAGLQAALEKPLQAVGYRFESQDTVRDMLHGLADTRGALPLLQFAAMTLWKERDRERRLLTDDSYRTMGGIVGALAKHADSVVAAMTAQRRKLARAVFERLVTTERTRAVVSVADLRELGHGDPDAVEEVLDELARARLLVVDAGSVEIVHESLIERWPTLRRWLDENQEDAAFLARLRTAAKEWQASGEATGTLWTGDIAEQARRWRDHLASPLPAREERYLDAVLEGADRVARRKRHVIYGAMGLMLVLLVIAVVVVRELDNRLADAQVARRAAEVAASEEARAKEVAQSALDQEKAAKQAAQDALAKEAEAKKQALSETAAAEVARAEAEKAAVRERAARDKAAAETRRAEKAAAEEKAAKDAARAARSEAEKAAEGEKAAADEANKTARKLEGIRRRAAGYVSEKGLEEVP